ncbi:putative bifunctional diguanylate cyclase/phosphodiesterase [Psychromonas arctica]|uniref:putative bifunctional diguanylate cyclase/phosphodiesterase n=1 Tax=Psychromonas arctica TaxID=168275 RepID=UPI002FD3A270
MKLQQITKSNNYILEHCVEKLSRINQSDYALGFLVDDELGTHHVNLESRVVITPDMLFEPIKNELTKDLTDYFLAKDCVPVPYFFDNKAEVNDGLLSNKYIDNLRYIPIGENDNIYAIIVLVNIELSVRSKDLIDVTPFLLATITLLKNQKIRLKPSIPRPVENKLSASSDSQSQLILESLLKNTFHPAFIFNEEFKVLKSNLASQRLFNSNLERGWPSIDKLINRTLPSIAFRLLTAITKFFFLGHLEKQQWENIELVLNEHQSIYVDIHLFDVSYLNSHCFGLMINERTEVTVNQEIYNVSVQRFNALTSVVPMAILQTDKDFNCSYVNKTWAKYTLQNEDQALGQGWLSAIKNIDTDDLLLEIIRAISHSNNFKSELELISITGRSLWASINVVGLFNDRFEVTGFIFTMLDISEERSHSKKLQKMANYDHLTGLSNRAFFTDRLTLALARVPRHGISALMFLDLDRFKNINDTLGHHIGDLVIQEVAKRLKSVVRDEDSIARLGGDEFAIIFTDLMTESVIAPIANKIVTAINLPFKVEGNAMVLSCSVGVAIATEHNVESSDILRKADLALYQAKDSGRNQFCFYESSLEKDLSLLNCLTADLNNLNQSGFSFVLQPLIQAVTENIIGFEALARWSNNELGVIGPDTFIPTLEENGLIQVFSEWLFYQVIAQTKLWIARNLLTFPQKINLNLSVKQLHFIEFADSVIALFKKEKVDPSWFTLEVTETAFIQDPAIAGENLRKLKKAGFLIALDDFGTGYSSLGLLRQMPLNYIKIDKSFVMDILRDDEAEKIVLAIIGLGKMLDLGLVAEGVEDADTKDWLVAHGCLCHQGYYFHKPLTQQHACDLLRKHKDIEMLAT